MSLELFFTLQNPQGSLISPAPVANGKGPATAQGLNFIDLILAQLTQNTGEPASGETGQDNNGLLQSGNPALSKNPSLDAAKILAVNEGIEDQVAQDIKTFGIDAQTQISQTLALNQQALEGELKPAAAIRSVIESLLLNAQGKKGQEEAVSRLEKILTKLKALEEQESPAFIATNLTPEQITQLQQQLASNEHSDGNTGENTDKSFQIFGGIFIGLINIAAPQTKAPVAANTAQNNAPAVLPGVTNNHPGNTGDTPSQDVAAKLNTLIPGNEGGKITIGEDLDAKLLQEDQRFKNLVQQATTNKPDTSGASSPGDKNIPTASPNLSYLQGWPFTLTGSFLTPAAGGDPIAEGLGLQAPGASVSSPGSLTSLITGTQSATQAHAATQMIAATIQKNAAGGENKNITLQLDPPELGRVKIKLEFGENKTLKTTMIIEKPETFLMLQRDAHVLERTIQEIGLDSGSGMEFELAQHEGDFGHDGAHDGQNAGQGNGAFEGETEIIEAKMDWYVDPQTGLTRYDMLV